MIAWRIESAMRILSALRNSWGIVFTDTLFRSPSQKYPESRRHGSVEGFARGKARGGRKDEETDSTIVRAMGRKDGRGKRKRLGL